MHLGVSGSASPGSSESSGQEPGRPSIPAPTGGRISSENGNQKILKENSENRVYANPPAGVKDVNLAAARDVTLNLPAGTSSNGAARVLGNWADCIDDLSPGAEDDFTVVKTKKRRRESSNSPTAATPSSNSGGARSSRRLHSSARSVPRAQEIPTTRTHITEARARQASSSEDHCVYLEHGPELQPFHYLRALDRTLGGTAGVIQISKVNGHQLLGLANRGLAERLINEGLEVEGTLLRAFPFRKRAERITVGNLPFFVEDSAIINALKPYGRVTSIAPKLMKVGPYTYNDGGREAFIVLREGMTTERLPTRLEIPIKGEAWPAYLSSGIKCSRCHGQGHRRANCPLLAGRANNSRLAPPTPPAGVPSTPTSAPPQRSAAQLPAPAPSSTAMEISGSSHAARAISSSTAPRPSPPVAPAVPMEEAPPAPPPVTPAPPLQVPKNPVGPRSATPRHPEPTPPARPDFAAPRGPPPIQETLGPAAPTQDVEMSIVEETTASSASSTRNVTGDDLVAFIEGNPSVSFARTDALGLGREEVLDLLSSRTKAQRNGPLLSPPQCDALVGLIGQILDLKPGHTSNLYKVLGQLRAELTKTPAAAPTPPLPAPRPAGPTPPVPHEGQMTEEQEDVMIFKIFRKLKHVTCLRPLYDTGIDVNDLKDAILFTEDRASLMTRLSPALKGVLAEFLGAAIELARGYHHDYQAMYQAMVGSDSLYYKYTTCLHSAVRPRVARAPHFSLLASDESAVTMPNSASPRSPGPAGQEPGRPSVLSPNGGKKSKKNDSHREIYKENSIPREYVNPPADGGNANLAAARVNVISGAAATSSSNGAALAIRNWADCDEVVNPGTDDDFTVVKTKKRRRESSNSPTAATPSSNSGGARSGRRVQSSARSVPRAQEIPTTRAHIAEARARQTSSAEEHCVYLEHGPELQPFHYLRALDRLLGGTAGVVQVSKGTLLRAFPFRKRAERITVGNLPFFVEDSAIIKALGPYGRITSIAPKMMKAGPYIYTDGRREAFIVLHEGVTTERLPTRLNITIKGEAWPAYLSSGIKCSRCHGQGHRRANSSTSGIPQPNHGGLRRASHKPSCAPSTCSTPAIITSAFGLTCGGCASCPSTSDPCSVPANTWESRAVEMWWDGGKKSKKNDSHREIYKENSISREYVNPPADGGNANLAAARVNVISGAAATSSSNGAALAIRNWADCDEVVNPGTDDDFTVVKTKKRRRESSNSPTAATPSSNSGGARSGRRVQSSARSVPRAQEIPTTRAHIAEARARQTSSAEEHCVYLEHGPELQPFHYLRALDRLLGGTAGVVQVSKGTLLRAFPFRKRAERITVGNLPFFVEDSAIIKALGPYGRITSIAPKIMKAGPYIYTDGRREAFIVLHEGVTTERLPTRLNITIKGEAWPAYLSSGIKCSRCHGQGHRRANCPLLAGRTAAPGPATPTSPTSVPPATAPRLPQQPSARAPPPASPSSTMEVSDVPPASRAAPLPPAALQPSPPAPSALPLEDTPPAPPPVTPAPSLRTPGSRELAAPTPDVEMSIVEETFASSRSSAKNATRVDLDAFIEGLPSVSFAKTDALGLGREEVLDLLSSRTKAQRKGPSCRLRTPTPPLPAPRPDGPIPPPPHGDTTTPDMATPPPPPSAQMEVDPIDKRCKELQLLTFELMKEFNPKPLPQLYSFELDLVEAVLYPEDREGFLGRFSRGDKKVLAQILDKLSTRDLDSLTLRGLSELRAALPP
ncbi:hypothetical protein LAZ67_15003033 [Cordylochernes scorpioides]|uniref:CCHC-type domain-containing protein n=1 Tax=Cordylochernes scorpioides TaxID=51811 RepID=A0ABY6L9Z1_9ARAC|nr:hypothetical protein LAZ67_15003033 [Cordylochernes scorpioides]